VFYQVGFIDLESPVGQLAVMSVQCGVVGAIWWVARTPRYSDSLVLNLGLVMEVMVCPGGAIVMHMGAYEEQHSIAAMTWTAPMIIVFPLVIPSPPSRVLLVSILATCTQTLVVLTMWDTLPIVPNIEQFVVTMFSPFGAVGLAYYASTVLWGLNLEVSRARRLGSYPLEKPLGQGGMGEVWQASHQLLARPAALGSSIPKYSQTPPSRPRLFCSALSKKLKPCKSELASHHPDLRLRSRGLQFLLLRDGAAHRCGRAHPG
jgi:hypothetical protein